MALAQTGSRYRRRGCALDRPFLRPGGQSDRHRPIARTRDRTAWRARRLAETESRPVAGVAAGPVRYSEGDGEARGPARLSAARHFAAARHARRATDSDWPAGRDSGGPVWLVRRHR